MEITITINNDKEAKEEKQKQHDYTQAPYRQNKDYEITSSQRSFMQQINS